MKPSFFEHPILNSPYRYPERHWELENGQPTHRVLDSRRRSQLLSPVPPPRGPSRQRLAQTEIIFDEGQGLSTEDQQYDPTPFINEVRSHVDSWRNLPNPNDWLVTPETARLLKHWRSQELQGLRPFFCQVEAAETAIWLSEVAPRLGKRTDFIKARLSGANAQHPELRRVALKLATGAGKTTVMAMLIAWQTVNAVRHSNSKQFTRGFLIVAPGITIRDRLRVLLPSDTDNYYRNRELVPSDMLRYIEHAKIVITNFHAFRLREKIEISKGTRAALEGWRGERIRTLETQGEMVQRVLPELMGLKNIVVLNDEAHHCYRARPRPVEAADKGEDKEEAQRNNETARLWISGLEAVNNRLGLGTVYDLSATPFFLRGSGYPEGALFPWTVSDFSLMDAIECGIVKLPRVPVADDVPGGDTPRFRNLWEHIGGKMPKTGRAKGGKRDPLDLPLELCSALDALYGHYRQTFDLWQQAGIPVPPVFIVVCNNTATSKLLYDYIAGFHRNSDGGVGSFENGRLPLFQNFDEYGNRLPRPRTLLIDSEQLESGEALDKDFRAIASDAIERFRAEIIERTGDLRAADNISDQELLREVMNTVGKQGKLGEQVRCVVSVSMLTEGWDANTVTHILGVRAFGTQLLCEQVVGRALRRQSYELNADGIFNVEYADILGIPFDFAAEPVIAPLVKPRETVRVQAITPERDTLEIRFPRVIGYRVELPNEHIKAQFTSDHVLELTPALVGPSITRNEGILGEGVDLTTQHLNGTRRSTILFYLAKHLLYQKYRDPGMEPKFHLFNQLKAVARQWLDGGYLRCTGGTHAGQLLYRKIADKACEKIKDAITLTLAGDNPIKAILDPYNPVGSTRHVNFATSKELRWKTDPCKCHVNWVICDNNGEADFCRMLEASPRVRAYIRNRNLGFEIPYLTRATPLTYHPDFIVQIDDGHADPLHLVVELTGYQGENATDKAHTMQTCWIPGVNNLKTFGRWAFTEFMPVYASQSDLNELIDSFVEKGRN